VRHASTAAHARSLLAQQHPTLVLIGSLGTPREPIELLLQIREDPASRLSPLPVILIGVNAGETEALRAFEAGADDYLDPGRGYLELRARLRALIRRSGGAEPIPRPLRVGALRIDHLSRRVTVEGREVPLRRMEYELLAHLARDPDRVFTRQELLAAVWGYRSTGRTRTLDSHASRLRRRLQSSASERWVRCVRGVGYALR
jgi:DNA-binding response OmpR family regulator